MGELPRRAARGLPGGARAGGRVPPPGPLRALLGKPRRPLAPPRRRERSASAALPGAQGPRGAEAPSHERRRAPRPALPRPRPPGHARERALRLVLEARRPLLLAAAAAPLRYSATTPATDWDLRARHDQAMFAWARAHPAKPVPDRRPHPHARSSAPAAPPKPTSPAGRGRGGAGRRPGEGAHRPSGSPGSAPSSSSLEATERSTEPPPIADRAALLLQHRLLLVSAMAT